MARKKATIEQHATFALAITRIEREILELLKASEPYSTKRECSRLLLALRHVGRFRSRMDDILFIDHPDLGNEWFSLYYGTSSDVDNLLKAWEDEHAAQH